MADDFGVLNQLNILLPIEKMRDSKSQHKNKEALRKRDSKQRKKQNGGRFDKEDEIDSLDEEDSHPGKILDITI
jgi:hypothetical protein